jgi:hypothetical protein
MPRSDSDEAARPNHAAPEQAVQPQAARKPGEEEPMLYCPRCSTRLSERKCKLFCAQCGYYMSCADYY